MRLGLIARADNSGLGVQCAEFARHMNPDKTLVIDVGHLYNQTDHANKNTFLDRYPGALIHSGWVPDRRVIEQFVDGLDVVFTAETTYTPEFITIAHQHGVRVVNQYNLEFLGHALYQSPHADVFAAPSLWMWDALDVPNRIHLPVPIALDRFGAHGPDPVRRGSPPSSRLHLLHVVGRPAVHDRNGTPDLFDALRHIKADVIVTAKCQDIEYLDRQRRRVHVPDNVELRLDSGDVHDYWQLYAEGDVLVLPRRFGGLCLPFNEAIGAGLPIITTDIDPNNTWLPGEWLVPASKVAEFMATVNIDVMGADPVALAAKIDEFADDKFLTVAQKCAAELARENSWDALKPKYLEVLT